MRLCKIAAIVTLAGSAALALPLQPPTRSRGGQTPQAPLDRASIVWPPGHDEPNTPGMPYLTPKRRPARGDSRRLWSVIPARPEFVTYHPANSERPRRPQDADRRVGQWVVLDIGNRFRYFLTEIASHGYLALAGGPMGTKERETITMASNNPTRAVGAPRAGGAAAPQTARAASGSGAATSDGRPAETGHHVGHRRELAPGQQVLRQTRHQRRRGDGSVVRRQAGGGLWR